MPATHKIVNGVEVPLSPAEAADIEAEWAANPPLTPQQILEALRSRAAAVVDRLLDEQAAVNRAILLVMMDEINLLRQRDVDRSIDVAAAANLADLKTRWAARAALPQRTANQIRPAVQAKITNGSADS